MSYQFEGATLPEGVDMSVRHCVWVSESMPADGGGFVPNLVFEGQCGYYPLTGEDGRPWVWGPKIEQAQEQADEFNASLGIDPDQARSMVASSMTASFGQRLKQD